MKKEKLKEYAKKVKADLVGIANTILKDLKKLISSIIHYQFSLKLEV